MVNNAYSGQYGQQAGAQVSYVTKSGTNQFHGNAEYWWTGRAMDANDWFNNLNGTPRPFANNNEWAASLGGPIKKDKTFFFVDTEGIRYIVPSSHAGVCAEPELSCGHAGEPRRQRSQRGTAVLSSCSICIQTAPGYNVTAFGPGDGGNCGVTIVGNCIGQYQATPALARNGVDPQRTHRPELLRQGPRLLARAHGPWHAGHDRRSHQQRLQRGQLPARVRRPVAVEPRIRRQRDQPVHRGRQLLSRYLHPERSRAVPVLRRWAPAST